MSMCLLSINISFSIEIMLSTVTNSNKVTLLAKCLSTLLNIISINFVLLKPKLKPMAESVWWTENFRLGEAKVEVKEDNKRNIQCVKTRADVLCMSLFAFLELSHMHYIEIFGWIAYDILKIKDIPIAKLAILLY